MPESLVPRGTGRLQPIIQLSSLPEEVGLRPMKLKAWIL
jgi:hypothetical protein